MKSIALFLAMCFSLLAFQPMLGFISMSYKTQTENCTMQCCKDQKTKGVEQNNCCNTGFCSSLGMCQLLFINNTAETSVVKNNFTYKAKLSTIVDNNFVFTFLSDCFHPPEFA